MGKQIHDPCPDFCFCVLSPAKRVHQGHIKGSLGLWGPTLRISHGASEATGLPSVEWLPSVDGYMFAQHRCF